MTDDDRKNPKEIIEKLEADFKPKTNVIYERCVFFSCDQKSNETFDAYFTSLERLPSICEIAQLEE